MNRMAMQFADFVLMDAALQRARPEFAATRESQRQIILCGLRLSCALAIDP